MRVCASLSAAGWAAPLALALLPAAPVPATEPAIPPLATLVATIGPELEADNRFAGPFGISVTGDGSLLVADDLGHRIYRLRADGTLLGRIGRRGSGRGELAWVDAALEGPGGALYVADTGNNRIQVLDPDGTPRRVLRRWRLLGTFANPRDLAFDRGGRLYVADWGNGAVRVFDARLRYLRTLGRGGELALERPISVAVGSQGRIFVADHARHRIAVFAADGTPLAAIGSEGSGPGELRHPSGLAFDALGRLYVAEAGNARIQAFGNGGESLGILRAPGGVRLAIERPTDLAFAPGDRLYVVDQGAQRILVLALGQQ